MSMVDEEGTVARATELLTRLRKHGWTAAVAESLTGGLVTSAIVEIPGASASLHGGLVAYSTALKASLLHVSPQLLADHGPVHAEVAAQMALGVRDALAVDGRPADLGIATTGIAGPVSPDGQPVGTVFIGVATPEGVRTEKSVFSGGRSAIRAQSVRRALELACDVL